MNRHIILCVDDEPSILSSLKRDLRGEDYEVITAASGEEALDLLRKDEFSLIISDQKMPSMTGVELLQKVRELYPDTVKILLTGHLEIETAVAAINKGEVYRYLFKPWEKEDLLMTVKQSLEKLDLVRIIREQRDRLAEINKDLSREKAMVSTIINAMGEGLIVTDRNGNITFVNRVIEKLAMKSEEDIFGKGIDDLFERCSGDREAHPTIGRCYLKIGAERVPVMMISSPLIDGNGVHMGTVNTVRDISAECELEQKKADFLAMIVHDLRSPLISNIYGARLIKKRLKESLNGELSEIIESNMATLDRALNLVNDLLDISKFESGNLEIKNEDINIGDILDISVKSFRTMAEMAGITIGIEAGPDIPRIRGNRDLLIRVMINLIGNAVKFSPQGGDVRVSALATGFGVKVSVIDKGPGIPNEKLSSIFDRYVQLDRETEKMKMGTGLGLTICKQIVEAHGGRIRAENAVGGGSIFILELPHPALAKSPYSLSNS